MDISTLSDSFPFEKLMSVRIREILLVCSDYDHFKLEEDGRIDELLFQEYVSLSLRYPPKVSHSSSGEDALSLLEEGSFDLVILMLSVGDIPAAELAAKIKSGFPEMPVILLTPVSSNETLNLPKLTELRDVDYIFSWQSNVHTLLAMVKLLEDRMNAGYDINTLGVQCIILVEDSVRYYSSYLPVIYESLIRQAHNAMTEGLNEWQQTVRMRGRPKILLARNFEEAIALYEQFKDNLLGIISDIEFLKAGSLDQNAGFTLCDHIKSRNKDIPILLQSSSPESFKTTDCPGVTFLNKQTKTLLKDLEYYIRSNYGFGDFIFRDPETGSEIGRASNLRELQYEITELDQSSFAYHVERLDFSQWLMARSLFKLAKQIRKMSVEDTDGIEGMRKFIFSSIRSYRGNIGKGVIAEFDRNNFDELSQFSRIGNGSLGGKGRGLAFANLQLHKHEEELRFPGVSISIPRTIILTTQFFDDLMMENDLWGRALQETDDEIILQAFLAAAIPENFIEDLDAILDTITDPVAVRSSSLLEDSLYQPFAGVYKTYMLSNNNSDFSIRRKELHMAIKAVCASTFFSQSKSYMRSTNNNIEEEKMAVIIQNVSGSTYGSRFFPNISGVARSLNFYPISPEKPEDGIVDAAFGLGKTIVDGGTALRFCPAYPKKIIQLADPDSALKTTQKSFYALNLDHSSFTPEAPSGSYLRLLDISDEDSEGPLKQLISVYDFQNHRLRDGGNRPGTKVLTFAGILKHKAFPLPEILETLLKIGRESMNVPVEIEFAVNLDTPEEHPAVFSFLQIRPIVENFENSDIEIPDTPPENTLLYSENALGNGVYRDIFDIVYIKQEAFDRSRMKEMGEQLNRINSDYVERNSAYMLVVSGRLGSTDPWLGIPITWPAISQAKVIVESGTRDFRVEPSQGTHFFHNITSLGCGYLTINPDVGEGIFSAELLDSRPAVEEDEFFRIVRFSKPLEIRINGKTGKALITEQS